MKKKAAFFDRDGVLNVDKAYLYQIEEFEWVTGAREAIKYLKGLGYLVIVVTNQSGVARGYYKEQDVHRLHDYMQSELEKIGTSVDAFYYCPHLPDAMIAEHAMDCMCRKPQPGMVIQAIQEWEIDPIQSFIIGDKQRDLEAGARAGVTRGFLYSSGDLLEFVEKMIKL